MGKTWSPITTPRLAGFAAAGGLFLLLVLRSEPGFVFLLDHANLLFHEAGHVVVRLFSERLETYGGTLGQLFFPLVLAVSFWRKGQPLPFAASLVWFFENWLNIARYMADARALVLPLVGGGDHDWNTILERWGALGRDTDIADELTDGAWAGMLLVCAWVVWRWVADRQRGTEDGADAETPTG